MAKMPKDKKIRKFIVPNSIAPLLSLIPNIDIYPVKSLKSAIDFLIGENDIEIFKKIDPNLLYISQNSKNTFIHL